jgi:hypothetical protein
MELKKFLERTKEKADNILNLYNSDEIIINLDKLSKEVETDHDVIYYKSEKSNEEKEFIFVFGYEFFIKELEDQEFKKLINEDAKFFKIMDAYFKAKSKFGKVKVSDILNEIQDKEKDSLELHKYLEKILTQAYYLGWPLRRDQKDFEEDFFIEIPNRYLLKMKQRFNFDIIEKVYENEELFIFLNAKTKLYLILKNKNYFTQNDIIEKVIPAIKEKFQINEIKLE